MDRRNDTHLKGRKLDLYCIRFLKHHKEALRIKKDLKLENENKKRFIDERNALCLARKVLDGLDDDAIVEPCPGCLNCTDGINCYRVTVHK